MRIVTVIALSIAAALAVPALASATTYCVGEPGGICDASTPGTPQGLQQVLTEVQNTGGAADLVKIGPGTYPGNFDYSAPVKKLEIRGSGTATVIQGVGSGPALDVSAGPGSVVSSLKVEMADFVLPTVGLRIGSAVAEGVRVENPHGMRGTAVELLPNGDVSDSTILAGAATGVAQVGGAAAHTLRDSLISGQQAVLGTTGTWTFQRLHVIGRLTGIGAGGSVTVRDSLIRVLGETGFTSFGLHQHGPGEFVADHVTIVGGANATFGAYASIAGAGTSTLSVTNSILAGTFGTSSFGRFAAGGGTANIVVGYSDFEPPAPASVDSAAGPGALQESPAGTNMHVDPRFVDTTVTLDNPAVDFRLRYDSPLIDRGKPDGPQATDLAGKDRLVDGDGVDGPRRDMGAYEYQRQAPTAVIAAPGSTAVPAGAPVGFSAAGSSDPDPLEPLQYTWSFGDGATATGEAASHTYELGGARTITLTVTDPTGLSATATRVMTVDGSPPPGGSGVGTDADRTAPVLSSVSLRRARLRFRLSEAGTVRFSIRRRPGGRRLGSFVRKAGAGRNSVRFTRRVRLGGRVRLLAPGRYRLVLVATDPAGNRSAPARLPFRVPRP